MTFNVFVTIFRGGEDEDKRNREDDKAGTDCTEEREELENGDACKETGGGVVNMLGSRL